MSLLIKVDSEGVIVEFLTCFIKPTRVTIVWQKNSNILKVFSFSFVSKVILYDCKQVILNKAILRMNDCEIQSL